ncbi:MAG: hypothetical protein LIP03_04490, partial [Bacteroidales bacterium]|nr:hypothetical protein [Bacteroidales bacterium]
YLDSILEIQGDLKTEFGTYINIYRDFDTDNSFRYRIEINGKFKIKYTYGITFRFVVYDIRGKIVAQLSASVEKSKKLFQVVECGWCFHKDFKTLSNVQKIVMYWDIS